MNRRNFVQSAAAAISGLVAGCGSETGGTTAGEKSWVMPEEGQPHQRPWMAFAASERIWARIYCPWVRRDQATIATTIARFEPVSMLVRAEDLEPARSLMAGVELVTAEFDALWMRDTGPIFVSGGGAVDFNFNGWGGKQDRRGDARVAGFVTGQAGAERVRTDLALEGGALEVDGEGTAIITESSPTATRTSTRGSPGPVWWWRGWTTTPNHSTTT